MSGWGILIRYYYPVDLLTMPYYQGGSSLCGDLAGTYSSTAEATGNVLPQESKAGKADEASFAPTINIRDRIYLANMGVAASRISNCIAWYKVYLKLAPNRLGIFFQRCNGW